MAKYSIQYNNEIVGPMEKDQLLLYGLNQDSLLKAEGDDKWKKAFTYPEIMQILTTSKAAHTPTSKPSPTPKSSNNSSVDFSNLLTPRSLKPNLSIACLGCVAAGVLVFISFIGSGSSAKAASTMLLSIFVLAFFGICMFFILRSKYVRNAVRFTTLQKIGLGIGWTIVGFIIYGILESIIGPLFFNLQFSHESDELVFISILILVALAFIVLINYNKLMEEGY